MVIKGKEDDIQASSFLQFMNSPIPGFPLGWLFNPAHSYAWLSPLCLSSSGQVPFFYNQINVQ